MSRHASATSAALRRAACRYLRGGPNAAGFAFGKLLGDPLYRTVAPLLPAQGTLLDVGCGEAYLLALARQVQPALELIGIDHDARRLRLAALALRGEPRVTLKEAAAPGLELPPAEVVTCLDVLHYMPPPQQDQTLRELARAVVPGGLLIVRDNSGTAGWRTQLGKWTERVTVAIGRQKGSGVFLRPPVELERVLLEAGLSLDPVDARTPTALGSVLRVARREIRADGSP